MTVTITSLSFLEDFDIVTKVYKFKGPADFQVRMRPQSATRQQMSTGHSQSVWSGPDSWSCVPDLGARVAAPD